MRSDNLRPAPAWITPSMVKQIVDLADRAAAAKLPVPVVPVPTPRVKPTLRIVSETRLDPPPGEKIRPGEDGPREKPRAVARQSSGAARAVPAESASPTLNPPAVHAGRLAEEGEAATLSASPPRRKKSMAEKAADFEAARAERLARAKIGPREGRYANELALYEEPEFQELARIAFRRGIAVIDLAGALGKPVPTVLMNTKRLGMHFGKRPPLADPLTKTALLALADEATPLPELRRDRSRRQRLDRDRQARSNVRQNEICDDAHRPACRPGRSAASREPAPHAPQPARAQLDPDRQAIDRANKLRADAARRRVISTAEAFVDAGRTADGTTNPGLKIAIRAVEAKRAEEARLADPVEQAKTLLRRRYAPVCSMAVYDGDPDLFCVGHRKNLTRAELLELAAKVAA